MAARLNQRIKALEQASTEQQFRVTRIELVDGVTGEVAAVIPVGGPPSRDAVLEALEYKHETNPPRKVRSRSADYK